MKPKANQASAVGSGTEKPHWPSWASVLAQELVTRFADHPASPEVELLINGLGEALALGHTALAATHIPDHPLIVAGAEAKRTPKPLVRVGDQLYFYRHWLHEYELAVSLARLAQPLNSQIAQPNPAGLNERQYQALCAVLQQGFTVITGGPGTGKTYTLAAVIRTLTHAQPDLRVAMTAPTGKAAQRMQQALERSLGQATDQSPLPIEASTIHRLLGLGMRGVPRFHAGNPLPVDLLVIDEGSMLDLALARHLFAAVRQGTRVIMLGDADQLAAVSAGAVLSDLGQTHTWAPYRVHLEQSQRLDGESGIGQLAQAVLAGDQQRLFAAVQQFHHHLSYERLPADRQTTERERLYDQLWQGYSAYQTAVLQHLEHPQPAQTLVRLMSAFDQFRVLSAQRRGVWGIQAINEALTHRLRAALQAHGLDSRSRDGWYAGRPVMITRNDYGLGLANGDIGWCLRDPLERQLMVNFAHRAPIAVSRLPPDYVETSFAMTIHKSQGSEFERVALVLDERAEALLARELIYTGITRAKSHLDLYASRRALAVSLAQRSQRQTGLVAHLEQLAQSSWPSLIIHVKDAWGSATRLKFEPNRLQS